jgi:hypothetical protein
MTTNDFMPTMVGGESGMLGVRKTAAALSGGM